PSESLSVTRQSHVPSAGIGAGARTTSSTSQERVPGRGTIRTGVVPEPLILPAAGGRPIRPGALGWCPATRPRTGGHRCSGEKTLEAGLRHLNCYSTDLSGGDPVSPPLPDPPAREVPSQGDEPCWPKPNWQNT